MSVVGSSAGRSLNPSNPDPQRGSRRRVALALGVLFALHIGLTLYAIPPSAVFSDRPLASPDYQTHYGQTTMVLQAIERYGHFWAYDPTMLAGHPVGLIFDVDNKLHFLFTLALRELGAPLPVAFNLFALVACLLAPLVLWSAARHWGVRGRPGVVALALVIVCWHLDSAVRFPWTVGMISFSSSAVLSLLVIALFDKMMRPARVTARGALWPFVQLGVLLPLALLAHVWGFAMMVVPLVAIYLRAWRRTGVGGHAMVWVLAALGLGLNAYWLFPALSHFELISPSAVVGQANPLFLLSDWLGLVVQPLHGGPQPHSLTRYGIYCAALFTLWRWRREKDPRLAIAALTWGWMMFMAYCFALIPGLRETEPYRFVVAGILVAALFAAPWIDEVLRWRAVRSLPRTAQSLLLMMLIMLLPRLSDHLLFFYPELRRGPRPLSLARAQPPFTTVLPWLYAPRLNPPRSWQLRPVSASTMQLARFVTERCREPGRLLVQQPFVGEFLRWSTQRPILGGFPDRRMVHEAANAFRREHDPRRRGKAFASYLVRFNVRYVVLTYPDPEIEARRSLLEPLAMGVGGMHRIYRVRHRASYVARGAASRVRATLNRIEVEGARPAGGTQSMLLRFHYLRTLRCQPGCRLERAPLADDPVGFITVHGNPTLPTRFTIENLY